MGSEGGDELDIVKMERSVRRKGVEPRTKGKVKSMAMAIVRETKARLGITTVLTSADPSLDTFSCQVASFFGQRRDCANPVGNINLEFIAVGR